MCFLSDYFFHIGNFQFLILLQQISVFFNHFCVFLGLFYILKQFGIVKFPLVNSVLLDDVLFPIVMRAGGLAP
jgi:hypothetical protein